MEPGQAIKRAVYGALIAALVCSGRAAASETATVKLVEASASGTAAVASGESLAVDLEGYELPAGATIVVLQVYNHYYYHPLEADRDVYHFSGGSGRPVEGAPAFSGLKPMDPVFVLIGHEVSPGSLNAGAMVADESIMVTVE